MHFGEVFPDRPIENKTPKNNRKVGIKKGEKTMKKRIMNVGFYLLMTIIFVMGIFTVQSCFGLDNRDRGNQSQEEWLRSREKEKKKNWALLKKVMKEQSGKIRVRIHIVDENNKPINGVDVKIRESLSNFKENNISMNVDGTLEYNCSRKCVEINAYIQCNGYYSEQIQHIFGSPKIQEMTVMLWKDGDHGMLKKYNNMFLYWIPFNPVNYFDAQQLFIKNNQGSFKMYSVALKDNTSIKNSIDSVMSNYKIGETTTTLSIKPKMDIYLDLVKSKNNIPEVKAYADGKTKEFSTYIGFDRSPKNAYWELVLDGDPNGGFIMARDFQKYDYLNAFIRMREAPEKGYSKRLRIMPEDIGKLEKEYKVPKGGVYIFMKINGLYGRGVITEIVYGKEESWIRMNIEIQHDGSRYFSRIDK
jgi:hypothetical protein